MIPCTPNYANSKTNETIWKLDRDQILDNVNSINTSGIFNQPINRNLYLGSIKKENLRIQSAKALQMTFIEELDQTNLKQSRKNAEEFEQEYIYLLGNYTLNKIAPHDVHYFAARSVGDASKETIGGDLDRLLMGYIIVFIYIMLMLGNFNSVEQRAYLSLLGIVAIVLGIGTSYGFCQLVGMSDTGMNSILPFLLLGIGIDDMFVIVQGLSNVNNGAGQHRYCITTLTTTFYI